jgi:transposase
MMGIKERRFDPLPRDVSLEDLVPAYDLYRRLEERVDLSFVRDLVVDRYAAVGRPSVDPVVFFKLQLILFFEGLRSERQLMRVVADRLSLRWYCGYDLHEPLPDHSNLTRTHERFGLPVFRRLFEEIVGRCVEAGLVSGDELFFDSTKVEADAAVDSLAPRWAVEAHLNRLFEEDAFLLGASEEEATPLPDSLPTAGNAELRAQNAQNRDWVSRDGRQDRSFRSSYRKRTSDRRASNTDADATPIAWSKGGRSLGYQVHYVVDGGKAKVILNALVTPSEVTENRPMLDLLWRTTFRWRLRPHHVTGDAKYGTRENVAAVERAGVCAYLALPNFDFRNTGFFGPGHFRYDPGKDVYVCPASELLRWRARTNTDRGTMYRAKAEACNACELKSQCTGSENGRTVYRPRDEDYYDRVRGYRGSVAYENALGKRKVWVEPLFAEAKRWHGMGRFRLRTLGRVNSEALLVAAGQNLKRLLAFDDGRPKPRAAVAALRRKRPLP